MTTQRTTDVKRDDRELASKVWDVLLTISDHSTRQLLKSQRQMQKFVDQDGKPTTKAERDPSGYGLGWLAGITAITGGLNADMTRNDPSRLLDFITELLLARAEEDAAFDTAWACWTNMEGYAEADEEPDDLDYPLVRAQALSLISGGKGREAAA